MNDPTEKAMYEFSVRMKENKHSFNRMVKNFILLYMINTGNAPEGYQYQTTFEMKLPSKEIKKVKKDSKATYNLED